MCPYPVLCLWLSFLISMLPTEHSFLCAKFVLHYHLKTSLRNCDLLDKLEWNLKDILNASNYLHTKYLYFLYINNFCFINVDKIY